MKKSREEEKLNVKKVESNKAAENEKKTRWKEK